MSNCELCNKKRYGTLEFLSDNNNKFSSFVFCETCFDNMINVVKISKQTIQEAKTLKCGSETEITKKLQKLISDNQ